MSGVDGVNLDGLGSERGQEADQLAPGDRRSGQEIGKPTDARPAREQQLHDGGLGHDGAEGYGHPMFGAARAGERGAFTIPALLRTRVPEDFRLMFKWIARDGFRGDLRALRALHPQMLTLTSWAASSPKAAN